jgi:hypothetical protein
MSSPNSRKSSRLRSVVPPIAAAVDAWPRLTPLSPPAAGEALPRINSTLWTSLDSKWLRLPTSRELAAVASRQDSSAATAAAWCDAVGKARARASPDSSSAGEFRKRSRKSIYADGDNDDGDADAGALMTDVEVNDEEGEADEEEEVEEEEDDASLEPFGCCLSGPAPAEGCDEVPESDDGTTLSVVQTRVNVAASLLDLHSDDEDSRIQNGGSRADADSDDVTIDLWRQIANCGAAAAANAASLALLHARASRATTVARLAGLALDADSPGLVESLRALPGQDVSEMVRSGEGGRGMWMAGSSLASASAGDSLSALPRALLYNIENAYAALDGPRAELELSRAIAKQRSRVATWRWGATGDAHVAAFASEAVQIAQAAKDKARQALETAVERAPVAAIQALVLAGVDEDRTGVGAGTGAAKGDAPLTSGALAVVDVEAAATAAPAAFVDAENFQQASKGIKRGNAALRSLPSSFTHALPLMGWVDKSIIYWDASTVETHFLSDSASALLLKDTSPPVSPHVTRGATKRKSGAGSSLKPVIERRRVSTQERRRGILSAGLAASAAAASAAAPSAAEISVGFSAARSFGCVVCVAQVGGVPDSLVCVAAPDECTDLPTRIGVGKEALVASGLARSALLVALLLSREDQSPGAAPNSGLNAVPVPGRGSIGGSGAGALPEMPGVGRVWSDFVRTTGGAAPYIATPIFTGHHTPRNTPSPAPPGIPPRPAHIFGKSASRHARRCAPWRPRSYRSTLQVDSR